MKQKNNFTPSPPRPPAPPQNSPQKQDEKVMKKLDKHFVDCNGFFIRSISSTLAVILTEVDFPFCFSNRSILSISKIVDIIRRTFSLFIQLLRSDKKKRKLPFDCEILRASNKGCCGILLMVLLYKECNLVFPWNMK
jgi:hypothetical protein